MLKILQKLFSRALDESNLTAGFFGLLCLYLWFVVDTRFIYHGGGLLENFPVFFKGWPFFQTFLAYPGGLTEYICAFLAQLFCLSSLGAAEITLQAWLIYICTDYYIKAIGAYRFRFIRFIGPLLLLPIYGQYAYHFTYTMAFLIALSFVCLYLKTAPKKKLSASIYFLILSIILYIISGSAYLLFALLCCIYEVFFKHRYHTGFLYLLLAMVVPYVIGALVFKQAISNAFTELLPIPWKISSYDSRQRMIEPVYAIYLLLPLAALLTSLWYSFAGKGSMLFHETTTADRTPHNNKNKSGNKSSSFAGLVSWCTRSPAIKCCANSLVLLLISGIVVFFSHNNKLKAIFAVDYYSSHKQWSKVLKVARNYSYNNFRQKGDYYITHAVNLALYNTGRLGYDMLSYPQCHPALFLTIQKRTSETLCWKIVDTQMQLGLMNLADNSMTEAYQLRVHPLLLKRQALINLVKSNYGAARVYLEALNNTFFYNEWARKYLNLLDTDPDLLAKEQEIRNLRDVMLKEEFTYINIDYNYWLLKLLEENKHNKMAFEYTMAQYMLTKQLDKFVENLYRLKYFGYSQLPRHYEEAILAYKAISGKPVELHGYKISIESVWKARDFIREHKFNKLNEQETYNKLEKKYGDNYFFYYTYEHSGMKK